MSWRESHNLRGCTIKTRARRSRLESESFSRRMSYRFMFVLLILSLFRRSPPIRLNSNCK
jgi:hypothetical protein